MNVRMLMNQYDALEKRVEALENMACNPAECSDKVAEPEEKCDKPCDKPKVEKEEKPKKKTTKKKEK